ncbi:unnamed protein product [Lactuca saligna]|uniref:Uncharacterized protein n=1 Tax=Lactuca saligna TaxID=75948 RepID=A0AA35Z4S3_LACSI|nr:unnamed protein product [Lactuca saligna]
MKFTFTYHDFSGMAHSECITFLECFMQLDCKKLYYSEPGAPLLSVCMLISNEMEYAGFIFDAYGTNGQISIYVDHIGDGIDDMFGSERGDDDHDSCISGWDGGIGTLRDVIMDFNEEIVAMNKTCKDEFLNKLCAKEEGGQEDTNYDVEDEDESETKSQVHAIFNESTHWKKQNPILVQKICS